LSRLYRSVTRTGTIGTAGLACVVGGAVGNLLDRLLSSRGVVDFIDVGVNGARFYIFNLADAFISVGAVLLAFALWREDASAAPSQPADA
jgi:signal peptidase II